MTPSRKCAIFLSHASEDKVLATRLQGLLETCLPRTPDECLVFCSSDIRAIEGGQDWYRAIVDAVRASRVCLALLTPNSIYSKPWLSYESGAAYATALSGSGSKKVFGLLANGVTNRSVPAPLQRFQTRDLSKYDEASALVIELARFLNTEPSLETSTIEALVELCNSRGQRWDNVEPTLVARTSEGSPFNVEAVLRSATKYIAIIGQNLQWVARSTHVHDSIVGFLRERDGRRVDIAICDVRNPQAVAAWSTLNPDLEAKFPYRDQLAQSTEAFKALVRRCEEEGARTLAVQVHDLIPFGATVMDHDIDDGVIALHPMINHVAKASERPQFIIRRRANRDVFDYHWRAFRFMLEYGHNLCKAG